VILFYKLIYSIQILFIYSREYDFKFFKLDSLFTFG